MTRSIVSMTQSAHCSGSSPVDRGRITDDWVGTDWLGALEQLGVIPSPWG